MSLNPHKNSRLPFHLNAWMPATLGLFVLLGQVTLGSNVSAQESVVNIQCTSGETVIFSSDATDIAAFNADAYGASLVEVMHMPDWGVNLYIFDVDSIVCQIDAGLDQSEDAGEN